MMGFPPQVVDRMSYWQYVAALDGWMVGNGQKKKQGVAMSESRARELGIEGF